MKPTLPYKRPSIWLLMLTAALFVFTLSACAAPGAESSPFGQSYQVSEIAYEDIIYSFSYTRESAPAFQLTAQRKLEVQGGISAGEPENGWLTLGTMEPVRLTKNNFDACFHKRSELTGWRNGKNAEELRRENKQAWQLAVPDDPNGVCYTLLQQKSGDVYIAYGYTKTEQAEASIRWLFRLMPADAAALEKPEHESALSATGYVSSACLYMNPLSSYMAINGDSGYRYTINEDGSFTMINKQNDETARTLPLQGWQDFPYTDEEWKELFRFGLGIDSAPDISGYQNKRMEPLSGNTHLLLMDDELWLIEISHTPQNEAYMWSIYTLVPEPLTADADAATSMRVTTTGIDLDACVSAAILAANRGSTVSGFACESHVTLASEEGCPADTNVIDTATEYVMALYQVFAYENGALTVTGGSHVPAAVTFDVSENGEYALREYWTPRDGSYYVKDIRERFPKGAAERALDTQQYVLAQIQNCYAQAVAHFQVDTDAVIEGLLDIIQSSPAASSNPADYIDAHPIEYRELTYLGDHTLRYIKNALQAGGETGLKEHILQRLLEDLDKPYDPQ